MRLETDFADLNPERLMIMLNAGQLSAEQVQFVQDLYQRRKFGFDFFKGLEKQAGIKAVVFNHKEQKYTVFHEKPFHPRDLFFIALFRHQYEGHLWARCPSCGAWFVDRDETSVCSIGCGHKMRNLASSGVVALPRK